MEERDDKGENGEEERKKEKRIVVVYCIFFMRLLCVLGEVMQHRIIF
jgi:hypothetical protein